MKEKSYALLFFLFVFSISFLNGCKDESDPILPPSEHFEPEGWLIRDETQKPIFVIWQGVIQSSWDGNPIKDTLFAPLNKLSEHFSIKFLNSEKKIINPPSDADHKLGFVISDTSIFGIVQDNPTDWAFHLRGKKIGNTQLELQVLHLGHADVKTPKIPVKCIIDTGTIGKPARNRLSSEERKNTTFLSCEIISKKILISNHIKIKLFDTEKFCFQPEDPLHTLKASSTGAKCVPTTKEISDQRLIRTNRLGPSSKSETTSLIIGDSSEFITASRFNIIEG